MDDWLTAARDRLAAAAGDDPAAYGLTQAEVDALLDLARVAAHESGQRTNAPLACFLAGVALGRNESAALADLVAAAVGDAASS
ncbi:MAG: DUF6457 domain-containing protein [Thermoleophilia bacterium]